MKEKNVFPDTFRKRPAWLFIGFCVAMFLVGIASFCGVEILWEPLISEKLRAIFMVATPVILLTLIVPGFLWGFDVVPEGFTIRFLWFKAHHAPWDEVSQVVRIVKPIYHFRKKDAKLDYLCVILKPADPLPYFSYSAVKTHWWMNIMLVWNLVFLDMDYTGGRCIRFFEKYWGEVEVREYKY